MTSIMTATSVRITNCCHTVQRTVPDTGNIKAAEPFAGDARIFHGARKALLALEMQEVLCLQSETPS